MRRGKGKGRGRVKVFWGGDAGSAKPTEHNWGDIITPVIYEALSGVRAVNRRRQAGGRMVCVGSLMHRIRPGDHIWGTGMLAPDKIVTPLPPGVVFHAVRGPMTREVLLQMGAAVPEVYGDPALLVPFILKMPPLPVTHALGIIPHFRDLEAVRHLASPRVKVIDICAGVEQVIREVLSCERILASSLHGVVLGDAYERPTGWLVVANAHRLIGGGWKFRDYCASTNRDAVPNPLSGGGALPPGLRWLDKPRLDLGPLLRACPFNKFKVETPEQMSPGRPGGSRWLA